MNATNAVVPLALLPLRVVEQEWWQESGEPDALFLSLSDRSWWIARYDSSAELMRVYRYGITSNEEVPWAETRLSGADLHALQRELADKYAEDRTDGGDDTWEESRCER